MSTIARKEVLPGVFVESKILETSKGRAVLFYFTT